MPKIKANGVNLHYITVGMGPDIVMLHGFLGNLAVWHLYMAPILRREYRVTTYDLRGHGYSDVTPTGYTAADMAEDLRCFLDEMGIERPILVGHSFGADIAMYFSLLYPERVPKLLALEPGLAALVHLRKDKDWIGWAAWVAKLEEVGIHVPEDKRTDAEFLLQLSLETPKFYGPARGLPRNREPLLHLIRNTTLMKDYEVVGDMTLDAVRTIQHPHAAGLRPRFALHQLVRISAQGAAQLQAGAAAGRRAFRPAGTTRAADRAHPGFSALPHHHGPGSGRPESHITISQSAEKIITAPG